MNSNNSLNTDEGTRMVMFRVYEDHRVDKYTEFRILPSKTGGLAKTLAILHAESAMAGHEEQDDDYEDDEQTMGEDDEDKYEGITPEEENHEIVDCPYGYESCNQDDFETMCDGCKADRGQAHSDEREDTYG